MGMNPALTLMAGGGAAAFDPITGVGWAHAYWAEGPEFVALGFADTDRATTYPDEIGTANLTRASGVFCPKYLAAGGPNSKPTVSNAGNAAGSGYSPVSFASISQPLTVVAVCSVDHSAASSRYVYDGYTSDSVILYKRYTAYAGTALNSPATDTAHHLLRSYYNGVSSAISIDNATATTGAAGANAMAGLTLFNRAALGSTESLGAIPFIGIYSGDVTADGGWAAFKTWVGTHYGLTIA